MEAISHLSLVGSFVLECPKCVPYSPKFSALKCWQSGLFPNYVLDESGKWSKYIQKDTTIWQGGGIVDISKHEISPKEHV